MNRTQKAAIFLAVGAVSFFSYRILHFSSNILQAPNLLNIPLAHFYGYPPTIYLPVVAFVLIALINTLTLIKVSNKKALRAMNYSQKLSEKEYDRMKAKHTREAVRELTTSEAYRRYLQNKYDGKYQEIVLSENDQIDLSDDSSLITK